ncbi:MAG: hypothetical protein KF819_35225 [Labilithrix sp.]|nr:hypothetical protein [Labilithrix sp.]
MSDPRVTPLLDDADAGSPLVRAALRGARADVPDAARMDALAKAIGAAVGGPGGGGDGGPDAGAGGGGGGGAGGAAVAAGATKIAIGGIVAVAAVGVAVIVGRGAQGDATVDVDAGVQVASNAVPMPSAAPMPSASASAAPSAPVLDVHALPAASVTAPKAVDAAAPASASAEARDPAEEMKLLRRAQDALASSPAEALARCEEHAKTYPRGGLAEEREVLAVDALLRLGRRSEAESRAARFKAAHPGSAYVRRLDAILGRDG